MRVKVLPAAELMQLGAATRSDLAVAGLSDPAVARAPKCLRKTWSGCRIPQLAGRSTFMGMAGNPDLGSDCLTQALSTIEASTSTATDLCSICTDTTSF